MSASRPQEMAAERRGDTRVTREPSPDETEAGPPERDGLGNGKCFRLSGDDPSVVIISCVAWVSAVSDREPRPKHIQFKYWPIP
eukprot:8585596-Pyramimonas_sp.AAC.1